jgi:hypothetical protein
VFLLVPLDLPIESNSFTKVTTAVETLLIIQINDMTISNVINSKETQHYCMEHHIWEEDLEHC